MRILKSKIYHMVILVLMLSLSLASCWDYRDISTRDITLATIVERDNSQNRFILMHEVADLSGKSSGVDIKYLKTYLLKGYGSTFEKARNYLEQTSSNPAFLGTSKTVIFDKEMSEYGIDMYLNRIEGLTDYRKTILPCISLVKSTRLTDKSIRTENSLGFIVEKLLKYQRSKGGAYVPTAGELFNLKNEEDIGYLLPCITVSEEDIAFYGHGVMKNNKMIALLNIDESSGIAYLLNSKFTLNKSITIEEHGRNFYSFIISDSKRKIKTTYKDARPVFDIVIDVNAKFKFQYFDETINKNDIIEIQDQLSRIIKREITQIIETAQIEYRCDFINFKKYFKAQNYDIYKQQPWDQLFENAKFNVSVKTRITDFNLIDTEPTEFNKAN